MNSRRAVAIHVPAGIIFCLLITMGLRAQVKTNTTTASGEATTQTTVERGEVVSVSGNDLVVKMEDGSLRHFANVPESARVTVDGKELGIHDLKPGMKLQRTIATTTTPKTITTVQTVTGTVWQVTPPKSVILRPKSLSAGPAASGENSSFWTGPPGNSPAFVWDALKVTNSRGFGNISR